jgi:3-hydroxybutyryl-CoA dehydratase
MTAIKRGLSASYTRTVTDADIVQFAQATGDNNAVHLDSDYAATTRFGARIAHGLLSAGLISTVLGTKLPGPGTIYLKQTLEFCRPVYLQDTVTATVTVTRVDRKANRLWLTTICTNQKGRVVVQGKAQVMLDTVPAGL